MRKALTVTVCVFFLSFAACLNAAAGNSYEEGVDDAKRDFSMGVLKIYAVGKAAPWRKYYDEVMMEDYGVEMVRKDSASGDEKRYCAGYNSISVKEVIDKYGGDVFSRAGEKGRKRQAP